MRIRFKKSIVAFGLDCRAGKIMEVDSNNSDLIYLLANRFVEEIVEDKVAVKPVDTKSKRVVTKRMKKVL